MEDAGRAHPDQDLGGYLFLLQIELEAHRVVAVVEDEQRLTVALCLAIDELPDLFGGHLVGVLRRLHPPSINRCDPGVTLEGEPGDQLVGPACDDGLTGGVARGVVEIAALGAGLRVAARPGANVYRVDWRTLRIGTVKG